MKMSYNSSSDRSVTLADFGRICRTCFANSNVHDIEGMTVDGVQAVDLLDYSVQIKVEYSDRLPQKLCVGCIKELHRSYEFKRRCLDNEAALKLLLQEGDDGDIKCEETVIELRTDLDDKAPGEDQEEMISCNVSIIEDGFEDEYGDVEDDDDCDAISDDDDYAINCVDDDDDDGDDDDVMNDDDNDENGERNELKKSQRRKRQSKPVNIRCAECLMTFETKESLVEHKKEMKHGPVRKYPCKICSKSFTNTRMKQHMRTHTQEKPFKCPICPLSFSLQANLKRHSMRHTGERPHVCSYCGKGFIQLTSLTHHEKSHEKEDQEIDRRIKRERPERPEQEAQFTCNFCGRCFKRENAFKAHLDRHTDEYSLSVQKRHFKSEPSFWEGRDYICEICSKGYKTKYLLRSHQLSHGEKKYLCCDCGKGFYTKAALQSHSRVHTGERPFSCIVCKKSFAQVGILESHMQIHSGYKPYSCKHCPKTFTQQTHLTYHMRTHTGEKPYECSFCGKTFALKGNLTVHTRTHTGETPYLCNVCGKGFYDSSSMKKHRRNHKEYDDNSECSLKDEKPILLEQIGEEFQLEEVDTSETSSNHLDVSCS